MNHCVIMMPGKKKFLPLMSKDICEIYSLLHKRDFVSFPLTNEGENQIESLVANINNQYFGKEIYKSKKEKLVAYLYFIIKNHPFTDGNKRTAVLVFYVLCDLNGMNPKYDDFTMDEMAVFIEKSKPADHQLFIKQIAELVFE